MSARNSSNGMVAVRDGVVEVSGRMTFQTVPDFIARSGALMNSERGAVTLDFGKVELIDSAGVALMLEWMAQARAHQRELRFTNLPDQVRHLIGVSGLGEAFGL